MAGETNAAIEAGFAAGASDVVVNDSHWQMRNLRSEDLHERAQLVIGDKPLSMTQGIGVPGGAGFDAAAFIGYHAGAGHPTGVIAHTYSSATVLEARVNGIPHNEAGLNAIRLGHHGVPVVLVSGDDALAGEVEALLPWAERVVVKAGLGYSAASSRSPAEACAAITAGMERALGRLGDMRPYEPALPLAGEIDFRLPVQADYAAVLPDTRRLGGRTVAFDADDGDTFYRRFLALTRLAATPAA
jgi:D-amino peptidase